MFGLKIKSRIIENGNTPSDFHRNQASSNKREAPVGAETAAETAAEAEAGADNTISTANPVPEHKHSTAQ